MNQTPDLVSPSELPEIQLAYDAAKTAFDAAALVLSECKSRAKIKCCRCTAELPISTQTYIQTHWYTRPQGCSGGDYWNAGEGNWICPRCEFTNRFDAEKDKYTTIPNTFYRPEIVALKYKFVRIIECYCEWNRPPCAACLKAGLKGRGREQC